MRDNGTDRQAASYGLSGNVDDREVEIGCPTATEERRFRQAGVLFVVSDLLWVAQAALIVLALGRLPELGVKLGSGTGDTADQLIPFALLAAAGVILIGALRSGLQRWSLNLARVTALEVQTRTRAQLLKVAATHSPTSPFPSSGTFASHVTDQVDMLGPYYSSFSLQSMRVRLVPIAIVAVTFWFSWLAALILIVSGPLIPVFMALIGTRAKAASAERQEDLSRLGGILLDRIKGLETLRLFGAIDRTARDIQTAGETFRLSTMRVLKIAFLSSTVLELFSALGIAFCAVYIGFSLLGDISIGAWGAPISFSGGLFVLLLAPEFYAPLRAFATAYHDRAAGLAAQEKLANLMQQAACFQGRAGVATETARTEAQTLTTPPAIQLRDVTLTLGDQRVFDGLCLGIQPGESVCLMGPSGCGKTSLLDCLLGFHFPEHGDVLVGDQDASNITIALRKNVMWLGQDPRLFHGSVKTNLLKGLSPGDEATEDDLWRALELAGADDLVRRLPRGLATQLGEDGFGLSVGEIRRIALARAAMRQNAKLLLADEPTAGLDQETANDVLKGLGELSNHRTTLIATHDLMVAGLTGRVIDMNELRRSRSLVEPA